jgi:ADP-ribosylglycohydrolase
VKDVSEFTHAKYTDRQEAAIWCWFLGPKCDWQSTRRTIRALQKQAEEMLAENFELLATLAEKLLEKKTLNQSEITEILNGQEQVPAALLEYFARPQRAEAAGKWVN